MTVAVFRPNSATEDDRMSYLDRLRLRLHRKRLDRRLAEGADPNGDPELRHRAAELTRGNRRVRIAAVLERILAEAEGPPAPFETSAPLARGPIRACSADIRRIVGRLDQDGPVGCRGVADLELLIREGGSPLYRRDTTDEDLRREFARIWRELS